jgi:hypothetical protein
MVSRLHDARSLGLPKINRVEASRLAGRSIVAKGGKNSARSIVEKGSSAKRRFVLWKMARPFLTCWLNDCALIS